MTIQDKDKQFVDLIKSELNESVQNINARDLSAITQARHRSLDRYTGRKSRWPLVPAGAVVTACLVVVYSLMQVTPVPTDGVNLVQEFQGLVSTSEIFNFYEDPEISEELDFYEWLDAYESSS
ncbi:MAG: hypothetical protein IIC11_09695 [Proteobacteria bacterium]|nr:hypothetical protein [Pseudomonadota bacterium]